MSKAYLLLIGALVLVALAIGAFAYFRPKPSPTPAPVQNQPVATPSPTTAVPNEIALTITSPKNGVEVSTATITVSGTTVPKADVSINEKDLKADASGNFTATITLEEGENIVLVTAGSDTGLSSEVELTITYTPAQ